MNYINIDHNCIAVYRWYHDLSFAELATRLGCRNARKACTAGQPTQKHINALANYEGISPERFCQLYGTAGDFYEIA